MKCLRLLYHENIIHCDLKPVSSTNPLQSIKRRELGTHRDKSSLNLKAQLCEYEIEKFWVNFEITFNRRMFCWSNVAAVQSKSSISVALAIHTVKYTRTSSHASIGHLKSFLVSHMERRLTCGVLVSFPNFLFVYLLRAFEKLLNWMRSRASGREVNDKMKHKREKDYGFKDLT